MHLKSARPKIPAIAGSGGRLGAALGAAWSGGESICNFTDARQKRNALAGSPPTAKDTPFMAEPPRPLCVDLDGTILQSDALMESFCHLMKERPWIVAQIFPWLLAGRAHLKRQLASRARLDVATLPLQQELLAFLREEKARGRRLLLVTASDHEVGCLIADHLQLFEEVIGTSDGLNLSGEHKSRRLVERFGQGGFDYAGNSSVDLPVWSKAHQAIVVTGSRRLLARVQAIARVERHFPVPAVTVREVLGALRVHQWSKNLLLFVPLAGAHAWGRPGEVRVVALGFAAFSLCASSVYLLNDLLDLEADRQHRSKCRRPLASGRIPLLWGLLGAPLLLLGSLALAALLPAAFLGTFAGYYLLTTLYSFRLKRVELLDVFTLASLYTIRVLAGAEAARVPVSDWLLLFCVFFFLGLAFVKRFTEMREALKGSPGKLLGRGYHTGDLDLVSVMGVVSGYLAVLVLALYTTSPTVVSLYANPRPLWLACPILLYWTSRVWLLAHRGELHDDPIVFALKDRLSWLVLLLFGLIGLMAQPR